MTINVVLRKARKEKLWSLAIVALLTIGLTTWMVVPSLSASLQEGLSSYANNVATYMFVYNTGAGDFGYRIPKNWLDEITAFEGVQEIYPVVTNFTRFREGEKGIMGVESVVIGGKGGFPLSLISVSVGKIPENEAGFLINGIMYGTFSMNETYITLFEMGPEVEIPDNVSTYRDFRDREYVMFNSTGVGLMPYNPMFQQAHIMWNSTFLRQKLGDQLFEQTYGGEGASLLIIKAQDINHVKPVAEKIQLMLRGGYSLIYDEATVDAQISFQSGSAILYNLIGTTSLFSVVLMVFLVAYVFSGRRSWEVGLLISQGWSWRKATKLFLGYYVVLGVVSVALSTILSFVIVNQIGYSFEVYGQTLQIPVSLNPYLLASGVTIALLVSGAAAYFAVWRMRKMGLDNLLREY